MARRLSETEALTLERICRNLIDPLNRISAAIKSFEAAGLEHDAHQLRRAWLIVNKWRDGIKKELLAAEMTCV